MWAQRVESSWETHRREQQRRRKGRDGIFLRLRQPEESRYRAGPALVRVILRGCWRRAFIGESLCKSLGAPRECLSAFGCAVPGQQESPTLQSGEPAALQPREAVRYLAAPFGRWLSPEASKHPGQSLLRLWGPHSSHTVLLRRWGAGGGAGGHTGTPSAPSPRGGRGAPPRCAHTAPWAEFAPHTPAEGTEVPQTSFKRKSCTWGGRMPGTSIG